MAIYEITGSRQDICQSVCEVFAVEPAVAEIIALGALYDQMGEVGSGNDTVNNFISSQSEPATYINKHLPFTIRLNGLMRDVLVAVVEDLSVAKFLETILGDSAKLRFLGSIVSSVINILHDHIKYLGDKKNEPAFVALIDCAARHKKEEKLRSIYQATISLEEVHKCVCSKRVMCLDPASEMEKTKNDLEQFVKEKILIRNGDTYQIVF